MSAEEQVTISKSQLAHYNMLEEAWLWYFNRNGFSSSMRSSLPQLAKWYDFNKNKNKQAEQQAKLDKKVDALLPLLGNIENAREVAANIILVLTSHKSEFSLLMPKVESQQVDEEDDDEEEDWDD